MGLKPEPSGKLKAVWDKSLCRFHYFIYADDNGEFAFKARRADTALTHFFWGTIHRPRDRSFGTSTPAFAFQWCANLTHCILTLRLL